MAHVQIRSKVAWSVLAALCLLVIAALATVVQGGPLDPPAGPGSTQRDLIFQPANCAAFPITLSTAGSYLLAESIGMPAACAKNGIEITSDDVELDLNGFIVEGSPGSLAGITDAGGVRDTVAVRNGRLRNWGGAGVDFSSSAHVVITDLQANFNGAGGIIVGGTAQMRNCEAAGNTGTGISGGARSDISGCNSDGNTGLGFNLVDASTLADCNASGNAGIGIDIDNGTVTGCTVNNNTGTAGILANRSTLSQVTADFNSGNGIQIQGHGLVVDCTVASSSLAGIRITGNRNAVIGCDVALSGGNGIRVSGSDNRVAGNNVSANGTSGLWAGIWLAAIGNVAEGNTVNSNSESGIFADGSDNVVTRNTASNNGAGPADNYIDNSGTNDFGPDGTAAAATSPWANISN